MIKTHRVTPGGAGSLIDPMNGTPGLQTILFFATPFATTDQGALAHTLNKLRYVSQGNRHDLDLRKC